MKYLAFGRKESGIKKKSFSRRGDRTFGFKRGAALTAMFVLLVTPVLSVGNIFSSPPAEAAPGSPGVPSAPTLLFEESFEKRATENVVLLGDYTGNNGQKYSADPEWINEASCNGFILDSDSPQPAACRDTSFDGLKMLAGVMEAHNGTKSLLAAYTDSDPGANKVQFRTATPINVGSAGRFLTFSVDAAATSCWAGHPLMRFYLTSDGTEVPVSNEPINPCTDPRAQEIGDAKVGSYASDSAFLSDGSAVGIVMRNEQGSGVGSDGAIDNIRILDVTPQLDKAFSPTSVPVGGVSKLTFTVTNTSELAEKSGWKFTDNLPEGLVVADNANVGGTCEATTTASPGDSKISVANGRMAAGTRSCTITVDVTSDSPRGAEPSPRTYKNCAANISGKTGLEDPGCAEVQFYSTQSLRIQKTSTATANSRPGDVVNYTITATNVGNKDYTGADPAVVFDDLSKVLDDATYLADPSASLPGTVSYRAPLLSWSGALPVDASVTLKYSVRLKAGGDGLVRNLAWQPKDPTTPTPPECSPPQNGVDPKTGEACAETRSLLPKLTVSKSASRTEVSAVGETVTYTITVTNKGPGAYTTTAPASITDDLSNVLDDATFNNNASANVGTVSYGAPVLSWSGPLAANATAKITYTVTYTGKGDNNLRNLVCVPESETATGSSSCSSTDTPGANLTQWKEVTASDTPVAAGTVLTYKLYFANTGKVAGKVNAVDDLTHVLDDAEVTLEPVSANGLTTSRLGNRITVTGSVPAGNTYTATYQVTVKPNSERGDNLAANFLLAPGETVPTDPVCQPKDDERPDCTLTPIGLLTTAKSVSGAEPPVASGAVLTYRLTFDNQGAGVAKVDNTDVLTDVLDDAELVGQPTVVNGALTAAVTGDKLRVTGSLDAGESAIVTYQVRVKKEADRGNNALGNFLIETGTEPPTECEDTDPNCTVTLLPRISVAKSSDPQTGADVQAGEEVTYVLTFANTGKATGPVDYTDELGQILDDADLVGDPVASDPALVPTGWRDGSIRVTGQLTANQTVTVIYTVKTKPDGQRGDNWLRNVVAKTDPPGGKTPQCEDEGVVCTEHPIGELTSWKTVNPAAGATLRPGSVATYTVHFKNTGAAPVEVAREDVLDRVLDDARITRQPVASGAVLSVSAIKDGRFAVTGLLQPNQSETVTYQVTVNADGKRGDDRLDNFLVTSGEDQTTDACVPTKDQLPDCTFNHISNVEVTKYSKPKSGTTVDAGQRVTYTLAFANRSVNPNAAPVAVDYTDYLADVLDDADFTVKPAASDKNLRVVTKGDSMRVVGTVPTGKTYTVKYTVTVKNHAEQGDHRLGNVVAITGESAVCAPGTPLCTEHEVSAPPAEKTTPIPLPRTGAEVTAAILFAVVLLGVGGGLLMVVRRRGKARVERSGVTLE